MAFALVLSIALTLIGVLFSTVGFLRARPLVIAVPTTPSERRDARLSVAMSDAQGLDSITAGNGSYETSYDNVGHPGPDQISSRTQTIAIIG